MRDVYVIGAYSTQFKKWPEKSHKDLTRDAYLGVLADAGMPGGDAIQFAWFGNCGMAGWGPSPTFADRSASSPSSAKDYFPNGYR